MMLHIGFSGSRRGLTPGQSSAVWSLIEHRSFFGHHGDCVGGDAAFDALCRRAPGCYGVVLHPSTLTDQRAYCVPRYPHDVVRDPRPPLLRDDDLVAECSLLIAAPRSPTPVLRSGTWATVRRARAAGRPVALCLPNGALVYDGEWPP